MTNPIQITIDHAPHAPHLADANCELDRRRVSAFDLVASMPWAMQPDMLETIAAIARREGDGIEAVEARLGRPLQNARKVTMRGETAIVPVTGPIFRYANLMTEISGATSLEVLAKDFNTALDDPAVKTIVLNIDSPGGQASGIAEFAQMVKSSTKPVVAYVDGNAASAAYWIASAAGEIVVGKTGMVGSIGAVVAIDQSKKASGVIEIVSSQSPKKRPDLSTDEGKAQIQTVIDQLAQVFIEDVAAYRGVGVDTVLSDFGQGDMRMGADSVRLGMADRIGTIEEVLAGLSGKQQVKTATPQFTGASAMDLNELRTAHPDLCAALVEEGRTVGATAERQRIIDVESQSLPGHEALIAQFKADGKTTGPMAAVAILQAERASNESRAKQLVDNAQQPVAHAAAPDDKANTIDENAPLADRAKAKWDSDADLRTEFVAFETYLAYAKAEASGTVKVLSK